MNDLWSIIAQLRVKLLYLNHYSQYFVNKRNYNIMAKVTHMLLFFIITLVLKF